MCPQKLTASLNRFLKNQQSAQKTTQMGLFQQTVSLGMKTLRYCRVCSSQALTPILSLGNIYVSDFVTDRLASQAAKYPLELVLCEPKRGGCGLLQLKHTVDPSKMYNFYYYHSGTNALMREALKDITRKAEKLPLRKGDLVLDIGCNDGTLLRSYGVQGLGLVGFDPAKNLIPEAMVGTTKIINDYFNYEAFAQNYPRRKAKVITSIAMFYDLEDPNRFVSDIVKCLDKNGLWIIQMSYLPLMLETNAFDNICHEHLEYYCMTSLQVLLKRHGLRAVDVELNDVNGGSFRVTVRPEKAKSPVAGLNRVRRMEDKEKKMRLAGKQIYLRFAARVNGIRKQVCRLIKAKQKSGKIIYAYGASTKGNTLLQYFNLDHRFIRAAAERNPDKFGKKTVGTMIPIVSEEEARRARPDFFLVLPWHFLSGFLKRETKYLRSGGRFIVPLPRLKVIPPLRAGK